MSPAADFSGLPIEEYAFPGPLRDRLVAAILDGTKTSTTSLAVEYENAAEALPRVGDRGAVVDSDGEPVCVTEVTSVRVAALGEVDLAHAIAEGEGFTTVAAWRAGHEGFWHGAEFRAELRDAVFAVTDETLAVLVRFRLVGR
jgi:uncharacterized protein YhfF